jgi:hypothetical protein
LSLDTDLFRRADDRTNSCLFIGLTLKKSKDARRHSWRDPLMRMAEKRKSIQLVIIVVDYARSVYRRNKAVRNNLIAKITQLFAEKNMETASRCVSRISHWSRFLFTVPASRIEPMFREPNVKQTDCAFLIPPTSPRSRGSRVIATPRATLFIFDARNAALERY